jgi:hypothetical protein
MPFKEQHSLQIRAETFNATNTARFDVSQSTLRIDNPGLFGRYSRTLTTPRVLQCGARYEF